MTWEELKKLLDEQAAAFAAFRKANDEQLAEVRTKGHADPLLTEQVEKLNGRVGELTKQLEETQRKANRPGRTAPESDAGREQSEHSKATERYLRTGDASGLASLLKDIGGGRKGLEVKAALANGREKAVTIGVDAEGGFAVAPEMDTEILKLLRVTSPMRQLATVRRGTAQYQQVADLGGVGSGWVGETDPRPETATPTLEVWRPSFGELYAAPKASQQALEDIFFDVEGWLTDAVREKFALDEGIAFLTGNGTNKPRGILNYPLATTADGARPFGTVQRVNSGAADDFDADDLITLIHTLGARYRQGASFLLPNLTVARLRRLKDANGAYIWQPGMQAGAPQSIFGFPVVEDENVPAIGAGANAVLFGNFAQAYLIVDVVDPMTVLRDPYTNVPFVRFYVRRRVGGGLRNSEAVKVLTLAV